MNNPEDLNMLTSPQSGPEWENAIEKTLASGEQLINYVNCWYQNDEWPTVHQWWDIYEWHYLAVTNINLHVGQWRWEYKRRTLTQILPECTQTVCVSLDDVTTVQQFEFTLREYHWKWGNVPSSVTHAKKMLLSQAEMHTGLNKQNAKSKVGGKKNLSELPIYGLNLKIKEHDETFAFSIFETMKTLGKNIQEVKSGNLLASRTGEAAGTLKQLTTLLDEGVITQEEFDRAKGGFLGSTTEAQESSASQLRQLHSLYRDGVLTEGEFNMKKWDILSKN